MTCTQEYIYLYILRTQSKRKGGQEGQDKRGQLV